MRRLRVVAAGLFCRLRARESKLRLSRAQTFVPTCLPAVAPARVVFRLTRACKYRGGEHEVADARSFGSVILTACSPRAAGRHCDASAMEHDTKDRLTPSAGKSRNARAPLPSSSAGGVVSAVEWLVGSGPPWPASLPTCRLSQIDCKAVHPLAEGRLTPPASSSDHRASAGNSRRPARESWRVVATSFVHAQCSPIILPDGRVSIVDRMALGFTEFIGGTVKENLRYRAKGVRCLL